MNRLMNCDHVFDILTRAPFPTGDTTDADVEQHLRACHECRQLAEALRPALDLFHESIPPGESFDLPGYMGELFAAAADDDRATTTVVRAHPAMRRAVKRGMASSGFGVAICAVVCFGLLLSFGRELLPSRLAGTSTDSHRSNLSGIELLTSLNLPPICREAFDPTSAVVKNDPFGTLAKAETERRTRCCTECHAVANPDRPKLASTVKLTSSCTACHRLDRARYGRQATLRHEQGIPPVASLASLGSPRTTIDLGLHRSL